MSQLSPSRRPFGSCFAVSTPFSTVHFESRTCTHPVRSFPLKRATGAAAGAEADATGAAEPLPPADDDGGSAGRSLWHPMLTTITATVQSEFFFIGTLLLWGAPRAVIEPPRRRPRNESPTSISSQLG